MQIKKAKVINNKKRGTVDKFPFNNLLLSIILIG